MLKNFIKLFSFIALVTMFSCKSESTSNATETPASDSLSAENTVPADSVQAAPASMDQVTGVFTIDNASSHIEWTGSKPTGKHVGLLGFKSGSFELAGGELKSGTFEIDMNKITSTDLKPEDGKEKLEGHLKSADFFDVAKFPTAKFVVKKAEKITGQADHNYKVTGDLTVKGVTNEVMLNLNLVASNDGVKLAATSASFEIDRTKYGIKYNSGIINTAKDKLIADQIGLLISITAMK